MEQAAERLTLPGIGSECGASLGVNRTLFQGFFFAPHTVSQALKTMAFAAGTLVLAAAAMLRVKVPGEV